MCGWFHTRGTVELISLDWVGFLLFGMSGEVFLVVFCFYLLGCRVSSLVPFFVRNVRLVPYQRDWDTCFFPWPEGVGFLCHGIFPEGSGCTLGST